MLLDPKTVVLLLFIIGLIFLFSNIFYLILIFKSKKELVKKDPNYSFIKETDLGISLIIPVFNGEKTIKKSLESFVSQTIENKEVIIVNDGSRDNTEKTIFNFFKLDESNLVFKKDGIFLYKKGNIKYIRKANGGKSSAMNIGVNFSDYTIVAEVDSDSILSKDAFKICLKKFQYNPYLKVLGSTIRPGNNSKIKHGEIQRFKIPKTLLETFQLIEYTQSFMIGRLGWQNVNSTIVVSGAFGLFNKKLIQDIGGWDEKTVGEDMEIIVRIHKYCIKYNYKYYIDFIKEPLCITEVPFDYKSLRNQRDRWQRGLLYSLFKGENFFIFKNGFLKRLTAPFHYITEILSPFLEWLSYFLILYGLYFEFIELKIVLLFLATGISFQSYIWIWSFFLEEKFLKRKINFLQLTLLFSLSIFQNFGYRQMLSLFRIRGILSFLMKKSSWGEINRKGL